MPRFMPYWLWPALLWVILTVVSLAIRPLIPVDETRYLAVAWEMWVRDDFLVPYLNGEAYSHKPPLLFWLIQLSWWVFGVNDWTPRIISPLFALSTLYLSRSVAKLLWPGRNQIADLTPLVLLGFFVWLVFCTLTMFDIMLTFFALVGIYSLLEVRHRLVNKYWLLLGFAIGGGVLAKGPVILLHVLPVALLAPWWLRQGVQQICWGQWYRGIALAVLTGAGIALAWAIPAANAGGDAYRDAIFLGQMSGRIVDSFAHKLPWWWYLQILPIMLLPWLLLKPFWKGATTLNLQDFGLRFCVFWMLPVFLGFTLISGKRIHYLLPLMPGVAIVLAWAFANTEAADWRKPRLYYGAVLGVLGLILMLLPGLNGHFHWREELSGISSIWGGVICLGALLMGWFPGKAVQDSVCLVSLASVLAVLFIACGFFSVNGAYYDTAPPAKKIAELMNANKAVVLFSYKYHGQFQFTGRLGHPLGVVSNSGELAEFAHSHPDGVVLVGYKKLPILKDSVFTYTYRLKSNNLGFLASKTLLDNPQLLGSLQPI